MCCGAGKAVGQLPANSFLLGEDDGSIAKAYVIVDPNLLPNTGQGATRYVRGSGVETALAEGKIQTIADAQQRSVRVAPGTRYLVHLQNGKTWNFGTQQRTAEQYARQSGGTLEVVTPDG